MPNPEPCAFRPCTEPAAVILELLVEGQKSVLSACEGHVDWLHRFVEEDPDVRLVGAVSEDADDDPLDAGGAG